MKEYIEKSALIDALMMYTWRDEDDREIDDADEKRAFIEGWFPNLPAADVRPVVRGKWNRTDAYPHRIYCSACYKTYLKNDELLERWEFPMNFCPNCGASMVNENE